MEAADAAGVSRRLVNLLKGGRHPNAEVWRVLALLNALDVPLHADLLNEASSDPPLGPIGNQDDIGAAAPRRGGRRLDVFMHGRVVAALDSPNARAVKFTYADDAREVTGGLSCGLPVSIRQHSGQVVSHWLGGLLPDPNEVLNSWRALYGIKRLDPYALLWDVGQDVAGAAAFVHPETSPSTGSSSARMRTRATIRCCAAAPRRD
jgi:HipA-like protein